jgi:hypothetical protein
MITNYMTVLYLKLADGTRRTLLVDESVILWIVIFVGSFTLNAVAITSIARVSKTL